MSSGVDLQQLERRRSESFRAYGYRGRASVSAKELGHLIQIAEASMNACSGDTRGVLELVSALHQAGLINPGDINERGS